jgi:hypothetical protein
VTEILDCVRPHPRKWYAPAHYAFALANSRPLPFVKWLGALSLRDAPAELLALLNLNGSQAQKEAAPEAAAQFA